MWNAARRFERAAERAAAERARKAVLHAIGYEPTPAPAGIVEQLLHDSFFGIVPFFILIAKVSRGDGAEFAWHLRTPNAIVIEH